MADEKPGLHIDTDWKKQAQEEKKRLQEEEQRKRAAAAATPGAAPTAPLGAGAGMPGDPRAAAARPSAGAGAAAAAGQRELPSASLATLIQSLMTQVLYYLGELSVRGGQPMLNLDMAKHNIDLLTVLEEKTRNNLTEEEKQLLDAALYETRMRYVGVASQFTGP